MFLLNQASTTKMKYPTKVGIAAVLGLCTVVICALNRTEFIPLFSAFSVMFLLYVVVLKRVRDKSEIQFWIVVAVLLRVITLFFFPNLSDDVYRFIWDGQLLSQGINPLLHIPEYYIENGTMDDQLFEQLNSPSYFTIYPPVCQFFFWIGGVLLPENWMVQSVFLKSTMLLAEFGSVYVLTKILRFLKRPAHWVLIYALNPLVIIEISGNLHYEGWMIFFFLASYYALLRGRYFLGGALFGGSVMSKLMTAMSGPFLIKRLSTQSFLLFVLGGLLFAVISLVPFLSNDVFQNFGSSLNLYFQKFEFNGSFYYLAKWFGFQIYGYNNIRLIGPLMTCLFLLFLIVTLIREKRADLNNFPQRILIILTAYLLCSTTVHPWYLTTIIACSALTQIRFPIIWSYLIFLTYTSYLTTDYTERLEVVWIEYLIVFLVIIFEYRKYRE